MFYVANVRNLWLLCARLAKLCVPSHPFGHKTQPIAQKYRVKIRVQSFDTLKYKNKVKFLNSVLSRKHISQ